MPDDIGSIVEHLRGAMAFCGPVLEVKKAKVLALIEAYEAVTADRDECLGHIEEERAIVEENKKALAEAQRERDEARDALDLMKLRQTEEFFERDSLTTLLEKARDGLADHFDRSAKPSVGVEENLRSILAEIEAALPKPEVAHEQA